jgi:hypothetical protein
MRLRCHDQELEFQDVLVIVLSSETSTHPPLKLVPGFCSRKKPQRAWSWPLMSTQCRVWEKVGLCLYSLYIPSWRGHGQLYLLLYRVSCVDVGPAATWTAHTVRVPPATAEPLTFAQQLIPKITKIGQWACRVRMEIHLPVSGNVWPSLGRLRSRKWR